MGNITYTYKHCSKEDFEKDLSFKEEEFTKILEKGFDTSIKIDRIEVEFALEDHQENPRLVCTASVVSPAFDFNHRETGFKYSETARKTLHKIVEGIRREKEKHTH